MRHEWWWRIVDGPSALPRRLAVVVLAGAGLIVSVYLAYFQYGLIPSVWDPIFGTGGSEAVLTSAFSRALPVHDAALGALAYAVEATLEVLGGTRRWRTRPWLVLLLGLTAAAMALTALSLIAIQALVVGRFCTLCLVSAAISLTVPVFVFDEVAAALRQVRRGRRLGLSWREAVLGRVPAAPSAVGRPARGR